MRLPGSHDCPKPLERISDEGNNVLSRLNNKEGENLTRDIRTRFYATLNPIKGLSFTGSYTYNYNDEEEWIINDILLLNSMTLSVQELEADGVTPTGQKYSYQRVE